MPCCYALIHGEVDNTNRRCLLPKYYELRAATWQPTSCLLFPEMDCVAYGEVPPFLETSHFPQVVDRGVASTAELFGNDIYTGHAHRNVQGRHVVPLLGRSKHDRYPWSCSRSPYTPRLAELSSATLRPFSRVVHPEPSDQLSP